MEISLPPGIDALPLHRTRLEAACHAAAEHSDVVGMVIGGSFASSEADDYSDLDMQLVVSDTSSDIVAQELRSIADAAGPIVAAFSAEHVGLPHMLIVLYEDLVHADFEPVAVSALGKRNAGLRTHILWERNGTVSAALPAEHREDPAASLAWFEARVWTWSWYVQTKILECSGIPWDLLCCTALGAEDAVECPVQTRGGRR